MSHKFINILVYPTELDHGGAVVTHSPPSSEVGGLNPVPYMGKFIVAHRWSAFYSTEPWPTVCTGFLCPQKLPIMIRPVQC